MLLQMNVCASSKKSQELKQAISTFRKARVAKFNLKQEQSEFLCRNMDNLLRTNAQNYWTPKETKNNEYY